MIDLGSAIGKITIDAQDALKSTEKLGSALSGLTGPMGAMGGAVIAAGAAAGGALVALGASSVNVAREFESSMAIMSTAVDPKSLGVADTAAAMDILGDAALAVGSDTALVGVSASSASEAMTGLYKAGLSTGEIFGDLQGYLAGTAELGGALRASIDLAAASELDMVQASELAAITLATFGGHLETEAERAEFLQSAMNNFVQTADGSVASVADLQAAFVNVGPSAAAMGLSVEQVNTALGILSTRGITGSEAGTALKSMLVNLQRTTPEVTDTLDALGVSLYDTQGVMYSLPQIIGQLEDAMAGMTDEQRQQTIVTLAGSYGMNAMNALMSEGVEGWTNMSAAIGNAATMQETAAARTNTLAGAQEALSGVWETFQIKIGTALVPALTALADVGSMLLERYGPAMTAIFEGVGRAISRIIEVVTGGQLGQLFTVFEDGSSVLGSIFESFGMGEEAANRLAAGISGIVTAVQTALGPIVAAVTQFVSFKDVLIAAGIAVAAALIPAIISIVTALAPIILVFGAVTAAVALLRNAWENNWGGIQEKTFAVINAIRPFVEGALNAIRQFWDEHGAAIMQIVGTFMNFIHTGIVVTLKQIVDTTVAALNAIRQFWDEHGADIVRTARQVWELISGVIETAFNAIRSIFGVFQALFTGDWEKLGEHLRDLWETLWNGMVDFLDGLWDMIGPKLVAMWRSLTDWFGDRAQDAIQLGKDIIYGIVRGFQGVGHLIQETIMNLMRSAWDAIKAFWGIESPARLTTWAGQMIAQGLIDGIRSKTGDAVEAMTGLFAAMGNVAGIGGSFAGIFENRVLKPLRDGVAGMEGRIDDWNESMRQIATELGYGEGFINSPGAVVELNRRINYEFATEQERSAARVLLQFMQERNRMEGDYLKLKAELAAKENQLFLFQERQRENAFLQEQLKLLELFRENNLDTSILDGLILGINADAGAIMDAMRAALTQMISAAEYELGIASPSKVFREIGAQVNRGLIAGLSDNRPVINAMRDTMDSIAARAFAASMPALASGGRTAHLYGGQHFYFQQPRGSVLDDVQVLLAP